MNVWDSYETMSEIHGLTRRGIKLAREKRYLTTKLPDSLSFFEVTIDDIKQNVAIINSDNLDQKTICSMPGEDIKHGGIVFWMGHHWIVEEKDANNEVYTRGKLLECNYLLKWIDDFGIIREQWCNIEDGTKYLTGDYEDRDFFTTRGDSRIAVTLPRNEHTMRLGRENRFLVDDFVRGKGMIAFTLSKPLKVGHSYEEENGIYKFVLHEVNSTDDDNFELGIADYYLHFPKEDNEVHDTPDGPDETPDDADTGNVDETPPTEDQMASGKKRWI